MRKHLIEPHRKRGNTETNLMFKKACNSGIPRVYHLPTRKQKMGYLKWRKFQTGTSWVFKQRIFLPSVSDFKSVWSRPSGTTVSWHLYNAQPSLTSDRSAKKSQIQPWSVMGPALNVERSLSVHLILLRNVLLNFVVLFLACAGVGCLVWVEQWNHSLNVEPQRTYRIPSISSRRAVTRILVIISGQKGFRIPVVANRCQEGW